MIKGTTAGRCPAPARELLKMVRSTHRHVGTPTPNKNTAVSIDASIMKTAAFFFARHGRLAVGREILLSNCSTLFHLKIYTTEPFCIYEKIVDTKPSLVREGGAAKP